MNTFVALSLLLGVSALTVPRSSCSFELTVSGGESGTIGQLPMVRTELVEDFHLQHLLFIMEELLMPLVAVAS